MKIAIYDPYLDTLGGGEKYMLTAAECLSKNHEVIMLWDDEKDIEKNEERFGLDLSKVRCEKNIFGPGVSFTQRISASRKYDVIFYLSDGSIPVVFSKKLYLHMQFPVEWVRVDLKTKIKLRKVSGVICNSQFTKELIDKKLSINSQILYPPVNIQKESAQKENVILHVGRFMKSGVEGSDYKKQYFMIDTFKKLVDAGLKDWKLVIAASVRTHDLADFQKMQATAAGYPISFIINAINKDLWKEYNKAKIYWHASGFGEDLEKHPERAEHFGISTVEAMGAGAVPVVINAGGQVEIVEHEKNGLLWNTQEELMSYTNLLIKNEMKLKDYSASAIKSSDRFSIEEFCKRINQLLIS